MLGSGWTDLVAIAAVIMLIFSAVVADRGGSSFDRTSTDRGLQLAAATPATASADETSALTMYQGNAARTGEMPGPGPKGAPTLAWTKQINDGPGENPIAGDGRLFYPALSAQTQTFDLRAADLATGEELWSAPIDVHTGSVPAVANDMVYIGTATGLKALAVGTGDVLWTFQGGETNTSLSPVVDDGVVYETSGNSITALDGSDGSRLWSAPLPGTEESEGYLGFLSHVAVSGDLVFGRSATGVVSAFDIRNGDVVWTVALEGSAEQTFLVSDGVVAVTAIEFPMTNSPRPVRLHALDATTGEPLWEPVELTSPSSLAAADGTLFVADTLEETGIVSAYDIQTGEAQWTQKMGGSLASPVYVDGQLYVSSNGDGTIRRIDATTGMVNWSVYLGANGDPLVADGLVVSAGYKTLYAVAGDVGQGTPPPADEPVDLSGLAACEPPRTPPSEPLTGEPAATIDTETRLIEPEGEAPMTIDGRPRETTTWPNLLTANIPGGMPATPRQIERAEETIAAMAACSQRPGSESQMAGFFSDDFFRRGIVTPGSEEPLTWSIQPDETEMKRLEVVLLGDGRVAASAVSEPGYGTFLVFVEEDGSWLVDEVYRVVPEYVEGPQG